jgi:hypothetical protein
VLWYAPSAAPVQAAPLTVDWAHAFRLQSSGADLPSYLFRARGDGSAHDVLLTFGTTTLGILDGTSIVGFNPQPDPPGDFGAFDVLGLQFSFTS